MSGYQRFREILEIIATVLFLPILLFILASLVLVYFLPALDGQLLGICLLIALIYWGAVFASSLFLGRVHCSHTCPGTGLFVLIGRVFKIKDIMKITFPPILASIFMVLWFAACGYVWLRAAGNAAGFLPAAPVFSRPLVLVYFSLFGAAGLLNLTVGKIRSSHGNCPISPFLVTGMRLSRKLGLPARRMAIRPELCTECGLCREHCLMCLDIPEKLHLGQALQESCVNCGNCAGVCPTGAVSYGWKVKGD